MLPIAAKSKLLHYPSLSLTRMGVDLQNAAAFLQAGATVLGVGGALVDESLVKAERFEITERARQFVRVVESARRGE